MSLIPSINSSLGLEPTFQINSSIRRFNSYHHAQFDVKPLSHLPLLSALCQLLGRIFSTLRAQNPALSSDRKKYTIVPPQVQRDGSKKTVFANIADICRRMHRQPEHVIQFLFAELGTMGSIDGTGRLVIRGRFQPKQIENVLRRYIGEYREEERMRERCESGATPL